MRNIVCISFVLIGLISYSQAQVRNICYNVKNGIFLPDFTNCANYYSCLNNVAYAQTCPSGYLFDSSIQACNYPDKAKCVTCPTGTSGLSYFAVSPVCNKFIICAGGTPFAQTCQDGLQYNTKNQECDFASNVLCDAKPATCPLNSDDVLIFIPGTGDCTTYTICYKGTGFLEKCASGLVYDPNNGCVPSSTYACPTSTTTSARSIFLQSASIRTAPVIKYIYDYEQQLV